MHQGASLLDGVQYGYDGRGNRIQRTDLRTQTVDQYTYDVTNQLTRVDEATPATALAVKERFLYDAVGNRLGGARATNTYDASNELLSTPNASYSYDANGNLSSVSGTTPASYTWNPLGQMVASSDGTTFTYDYLGRRVSKGATFYVYDGADIVLQVNADGTGAGRFVHGLGTDEHLAARRGGVWYYYEQDGIGSVTSLTDAAGNLAAAYSYTAFGKSKRELGTLNQPYRYTGREWDNETGLYYYRARYYDPTVGRFVSEDPIRLAAGINNYVYVANNPPLHTDNSGLDWIFQQSTGNIYYLDSTGTISYEGSGFSGNGQGRNNPAFENVKNIGPLPEGTYTIGPMQDNVTFDSITQKQHVLYDSMRLTPTQDTFSYYDSEGNETTIYGTYQWHRGGFLIHGGSLSRGCIVIGANKKGDPLRTKIGNSGDTVLRVIQ